MWGRLQVAQMYNWKDVAMRTEEVYRASLSEPHSAALAPRLPRLLACGRIYGVLIVAFAALSAFWYAVVCWLDPEDSIERAAAFSNACGPCTGEDEASYGTNEGDSGAAGNSNSNVAMHGACARRRR